MKLGIVYQKADTRKCAFKPAKIIDFGALEIYDANIAISRKKHRFLRDIKKCARSFGKLGISMCAAEGCFSALNDYGIFAICYPSQVFKLKAADAMLSFLEKTGIDAEVAVCNGSVDNAVSVACKILTKRKSICIKNVAFDLIAERIADETGAVAMQKSDRNCVELDLALGEPFIKYGDISAGLDDFKIILPGTLNGKVIDKITPQLAEMLEISGFLGQNEIKVEYFLK